MDSFSVSIRKRPFALKQIRAKGFKGGDDSPIMVNQNLRARREQRESSLSLCRAEAVNGDVSRNLEEIFDRSLRVAEVRRVA